MERPKQWKPGENGSSNWIVANPAQQDPACPFAGQKTPQQGFRCDQQPGGKRIIEAAEKAKNVARAASEGKAEDIVILDVRKVSNVTDYYVICSGASQTHLRALAKRFEDLMDSAGVKTAHVDGYSSSGWLVLDYGDVIVHAMLNESRRYYELERLWGDAPVVAWA